MLNLHLNPLTVKRFKRFKQIKRSYFALWILVVLYAISLGAEFVCNDKPLFVRFQGKSYFPVVKYYPADTFLKNGENTRPDYHALQDSTLFTDNSGNYMLFPPFEYGPYLSVNLDGLQQAQGVDVDLLHQSLVFALNVNADFAVVNADGLPSAAGAPLGNLLTIPESLGINIIKRFNNQSAPYAEFDIIFNDKPLLVYVNAYEQQGEPPKSVRINFREITGAAVQSLTLKFDAQGVFDADANTKAAREFWQSLDLHGMEQILGLVKTRLEKHTDPITISYAGEKYQADATKLQARFPYPPTWQHPMGLDTAGRDVLARVLYGLRTSMSFGILLVAFTMVLGVAAGALQGYYGGKIDLGGQRFTEIWAALPFLYVVILMGSIYGRGFVLLLFCYAIFNWVGISYYMRAEFLRLRTQTFVEAAKCMGLPARKIIFRHILPNALVPVLTFFPFQLVGAIAALSALDYLGFGLPPPTPSWGELLSQGQANRWAWWLILYPGLALFFIMLLSVFVGDGLRNAYDPKRYTWLE